MSEHHVPTEQLISANAIFAAGTNALYWLAYAIAIIVRSVVGSLLWLLHQLYRPIAFTLQPVVYLLHFVLTCVALPVRALVKLETLYIYLGIAALVGIIGGLVISLVSRKITATLLEPPPVRARKVRSARDYRQQKQQQRAESEVPTLLAPRTRQVNGGSPQRLSPGSVSPGYYSLSDGSRRKAGLLTTAIMEEEDSEF